eukprot:m.150460 g.150460  ORF g.150460 m.150460 type:complete len:232 (-) comp10145_c1_seq1:459-1154(-)
MDDATLALHAAPSPASCRKAHADRRRASRRAYEQWLQAKEDESREQRLARRQRLQARSAPNLLAAVATSAASPALAPRSALKGHSTCTHASAIALDEDEKRELRRRRQQHMWAQFDADQAQAKAARRSTAEFRKRLGAWERLQRDSGIDMPAFDSEADYLDYAEAKMNDQQHTRLNKELLDLRSSLNDITCEAAKSKPHHTSFAEGRRRGHRRNFSAPLSFQGGMLMAGGH